MKASGNKENLILSLDVFHGCNANCSGCSVNKKEPRSFSEQDAQMLCEFSESLSSKYRLHEVELGPTDLITSVNSLQMLHSKPIKSIFEHYETMVFNSAFLSPHKEDYERMADAINAAAPNCGIGIQCPFEIKHVNNTKYIDSVAQRIEWLLSALGRKPPELEIDLIAAFNGQHSLVYRNNIELLHDLYEKIQNLKFRSEVNASFTVNCERDVLDSEWAIKQFVLSLETLNRFFKIETDKHADPKEAMMDHRVSSNPFNRLTSNFTKELFWANGVIYHTPGIYKNIQIQDENLVCNARTLKDFDSERAALEYEGLMLSMANEDCSNCSFVSHCSKKLNPIVIDKMEVTNCIFSTRIVR